MSLSFIDQMKVKSIDFRGKILIHLIIVNILLIFFFLILTSIAFTSIHFTKSTSPFYFSSRTFIYLFIYLCCFYLEIELLCCVFPPLCLTQLVNFSLSKVFVFFILFLLILFYFTLLFCLTPFVLNSFA